MSSGSATLDFQPDSPVLSCASADGETLLSDAALAELQAGEITRLGGAAFIAVELPQPKIAANEQYSQRGREDSLAHSVAILFGLAIAQRVVGLGRGILVCAWLTPQMLGNWDLANRFFFLAAPLLVLGLPGSFGRYLEYYRQRGALRVMLQRTTLACLGLGALGVVILLGNAPFFAEQCFGSAEHTRVFRLATVSLAAVIAYNFLSELLVALRLARVNAGLQFLTSLGFAALSVALLAGWRTEAEALIVAYAGSCCLTIAGAVWYLRRIWRELPPDSAPLSHRELWGKLLPFAGWVWLTNLLTNTFESAGRYMIVHYSGSPDYEAWIGNYHAAQLIPALIITLAMMLGGTLLPYLSRDWEANRRERVSATLNFALKLLGLFNIAAAIGVLVAGPILFNFVLQDKYVAGAEILPLALACCAWGALASVVQMYLWCAEKAHYGCLSLALGLVLNLVLNWCWLPRYGLVGGMFATALANLAVVAALYVTCVGWKFKLDPRTVVVSMLPAALLGGIWLTMAITSALAATLAFRPDWIFNTTERAKLGELIKRGWGRRAA